MALTSTYVFDQTDLRGNFTFTNTALLLPTTFSWTWQNTGSVSTLSVSRESREVLIDLYTRFNSSDFLFLIDIAPEINGVSDNANGNALMVLISLAEHHFAYRKSDIRAGWLQWRHVPYHDKAPGKHQDSDLLNQIAFNYHINRGALTVDNDGWIAFYFMFFLDAEGKLGAFVDGCAYQVGGGEGLSDGGEPVGGVLDSVLPAFAATIQGFLDSFCSIAGIFSSGIHDSNGYALFDQFYLLPGDGNSKDGALDPTTGNPGPFIGSGARQVETEVTLALLPKQKALPVQTGPGSPITIARDLAKSLEVKGWSVNVSEAAGVVDLKGAMVADGRKIEIVARLREAVKKVSNAKALEIRPPKPASQT